MSDWKNVQYKNGKMRTSEGGGGGGSSTFAGLDDVSFSDIQNGQVPKYNSTTQKWENANESGGGGTVTDVTVDGVSVVNGQGVAEIEMPTPPTIPVTDVKVNGTSVVDANNEAQIKSYKEVTQAEYQALPSSKLTDNILYCIKDSAGADSFPPLIYSDEEREVGVWRDGKPLYQKTYNNISITNEVDFIVDLSFTNKSLIKYEVDFRGISNQDAKFSVATSDTLYINSNNQLVYYLSRSGSWWNLLSSADITVWYTKTTDVAGSGKYTTYGGIAHHYSTSEQVIGTWIDGKPLYERVLLNTQLIELVQDTWVKTEFDKGNIGKIIKCSLTNLSYLAFNSELSAGFVDDKLAINSARSMNYAIGDCAIALRYTKTTD